MYSNSILISVRDLQNSLQNQLDDTVIFDCRFDLSQPHLGHQQYLEGHIPSSIYVDLEKDLSGPKNPLQGRHPLPNSSNWANTRARLGISENTHVILYDLQENTYSARMWWMLKAIGHQSIQILDGGFKEWVKLGGAVESGPSRKPNSVINLPIIEYKGLIQMSDVQQNIKNPCFQIMDARAKERFRGETEPLDPVAGHIPGAMNRPYKNNLNDNHLFKTGSELADEFSKISFAPTQLVHSCGSGVTACHNLLAMEIAGLSGSLLYAGSWSEWCNHPHNPIASGT
jgi:thiosulfate/3-mercaptopyruvate sulfurtransferase